MILEKTKSDRARFPFTAADLVIIAVIVLFGFFIYRYAFAGAGGDTFEIDYVVKVSAVRSELADRIAAGDTVFAEDGTTLGRVTAYEKRNAVLGSTGQTLPNRFDLYITVEAEMDETGLVAGHEIYAEKELVLHTSEFLFEGVCINVRK